jgi:hypothetical protein
MKTKKNCFQVTTNFLFASTIFIFWKNEIYVIICGFNNNKQKIVEVFL